MRKVEAVIAEVENKIHRLGEQRRKAELELERSRTAVSNLNSRITELESELEELRNKNKVLQVARSLDSEANPSEARKRINELVREIDKCIALLNK